MTLSDWRQYTLPTAVAAALALVVLYGIVAGPVHAPGPPPSSLSRLTLSQTPAPVPDVVFTDATGLHHTLASFRGRTVLLNLWATWCAPCVRELPALATLSRTLPAKDFAVVAVDVGHGKPADARAFLSAHGAGALTLYLDSDITLVRRFHAYGLPLSVLIDAKGREIARAEGAQDWDAPDAVAWVRGMAQRE